MKIVYNIIRGTIRIFLWFAILCFCAIVKLVTIEPGKDKQITPRKARRIRAFSKMKYFILNSIPESVNKFIGTETHRNYLNKHLANGLQLRNYTTNKRAV